VLKEINAKLDRLLALEARIGELEKRFDLGSVGAAGAEVMLPEVDENIVAFVRSQKRACAEEVQRHFNYRGRNAASSRLNRLVQLGVLAKNQVGKKMYFIALNPHSSAMK
ncbi:TPA: hypothetical protein HA318_03585, partial [Candidatus Micrarchaeota archaeon]|nr:hypothetical protein [Candidatus Micrarchaeota archaeon]